MNSHLWDFNKFLNDNAVVPELFMLLRLLLFAKCHDKLAHWLNILKVYFTRLLSLFKITLSLAYNGFRGNVSVSHSCFSFSSFVITITIAIVVKSWTNLMKKISVIYILSRFILS